MNISLLNIPVNKNGFGNKKVSKASYPKNESPACDTFYKAQNIGFCGSANDKNKTKKLPFIFGSENATRKERLMKMLQFQKLVKMGLKSSEKIIKDDYSSNFDKLYTVDEYIHSDKGYTDNIYNCICVLLYNNNDAYLAHLSTSKHSCRHEVKYMQEKLQDFIKDLSKEGEVRALLFGGEKYSSEKLRDNITAALNKCGVVPDEILYDKHNNPHSIYYNLETGIMLDKGNYFDIEDLKNDFLKVEISQ